jgi:hypothetical protein
MFINIKKKRKKKKYFFSYLLVLVFHVQKEILEKYLKKEINEQLVMFVKLNKTKFFFFTY